MGTREQEHRKRLRKHQFQQIVLSTVAVAGVVGLALVAPQALTAMKKLGLMPSTRHATVTKTAVTRLLRSGLLVVADGNLRLTSRGELHLLRTTFALKGAEKRKWDGRWRILIFDIPVYRKGLGQKIRNTLRAAGFIRLQDSVWAYPYDCEDFVVLLKADFRIGKDLLYMIVESLEGDGRLRTHFKLPRE